MIKAAKQDKTVKAAKRRGRPPKIKVQKELEKASENKSEKKLKKKSKDREYKPYVSKSVFSKP